MSNDYIKRLLEDDIQANSKAFPVLLICGPRQVGKTTILEKIIKEKKQDIKYVTLDDPMQRVLAKTDPATFIEKYGTPLIIDEIQYATELLPYIKISVDKKRIEDKKNSYGMYYLTGSQMFVMMQNVSESLAGRVGIIDMYGLSNAEITGYTQKSFIPTYEECKKKEGNTKLNINELFERILKGSYPEIYQNNEISSEKFYNSYLRTYIERDIRDMISIKDEIKFLTFMSAVAARTGQELNYNDIAKDVDIDIKTAQKWVSILRTSGLVYLLQPYYNNLIKKIIKRPKLYFTDTGFACYLAGYSDAKTLQISAYNGAIFENYVVMEIVKSYVNDNKDSRLYLNYYRDTAGKEIDLLIIKDGKVYPIEIKKTGNPNKEVIKNFSVLENMGLQIGEGGIVCTIDKIVPIDAKNNYIPVQCI